MPPGERRLGVALFERDGRRRRLRPSAQPAVSHARHVLGLTGDLADWASRINRGAEFGRAALVMAALKGKYDVVNLKLDKTGGLTAALAARAEVTVLSSAREGTVPLARQLPGPWHLVVDATGALTIDGGGPGCSHRPCTHLAG